MFYRIEWTETPRGQVAIHCPLCNQKPVSASVLDRNERVLLAGLIPLLVHNTSWMTCQACGGKLHSRVKSDHLLDRDPEEIAAFISPQVSLIKKFLAVSAIVLAVFPMVGTVYALIAWVVNRKTWGWPKKVSVFAIWLSLAVPILLVLVGLAMSLGSGKK